MLFPKMTMHLLHHTAGNSDVNSKKHTISKMILLWAKNEPPVTAHVQEKVLPLQETWRVVAKNDHHEHAICIHAMYEILKLSAIK